LTPRYGGPPGVPAQLTSSVGFVSTPGSIHVTFALSTSAGNAPSGTTAVQIPGVHVFTSAPKLSSSFCAALERMNTPNAGSPPRSITRVSPFFDAAASRSDFDFASCIFKSGLTFCFPAALNSIANPFATNNIMNKTKTAANVLRDLIAFSTSFSKNSLQTKTNFNLRYNRYLFYFSIFPCEDYVQTKLAAARHRKTSLHLKTRSASLCFI
jgi:hypothetical protein